MHECPNCNFAPHTDTTEACILWALLSVLATDNKWTLEEMHTRMERVDPDALWTALNPIMGSLEFGDFDRALDISR